MTTQQKNRMKGDRCLFPIRDGRKLLFEVTNKCNARCEVCCSNSSMDSNGEELSLAEATEFLDWFAARGCNEVYFSGGEPLLRSDFLEMLEYGRSLFERVQFSTNGFLGSQETVRHLAHIQPNAVGISLDAANPSQHDAMRQLPGLFENATTFARQLSESDIHVRLQATIRQNNLDQMSPLFNLAHKLGVSGILFQTVITAGRLQDADEQSNHADFIGQFYENIEKIQDQAHEESPTLMYYGNPYARHMFPTECPAGTSFFYLTPAGKISGCPWLQKMGFMPSQPKTDSALKLLQETFEKNNISPTGCPAMLRSYSA